MTWWWAELALPAAQMVIRQVFQFATWQYLDICWEFVNSEHVKNMKEQNCLLIFNYWSILCFQFVSWYVFNFSSLRVTLIPSCFWNSSPFFGWIFQWYVHPKISSAYTLRQFHFAPCQVNRLEFVDLSISLYCRKCIRPDTTNPHTLRP